MKEIVITQIGQIPVIYFNLLEDWESFDKIVNILKTHFLAIVTNKINGPETRLCKISIGDANFTLINDPFGNSLRADNKQADEYIYEIFNKWSQYSSLTSE